MMGWEVEQLTCDKAKACSLGVSFSVGCDEPFTRGAVRPVGKWMSCMMLEPCHDISFGEEGFKSSVLTLCMAD